MFDDIIALEATKNYLDTQLIKAIIMQESAGNPFAIRFEPTWRYAYELKGFAYVVKTTVETEEMGQKTSWGLMQVMGTVARELGFRGMFPQLCDPVIGIKYGAKKLRKLADRYSSTHDIIAAYNAGSAIKNAGGMYLNQRYVDEVFQKLREVQNG